jgi:hypothetical protein
MDWRWVASALLVCALVGTLSPALAGEPSADQLAQRARKLAGKGDYAGAWLAAMQAIARSPNDPALHALADAYQRRGLQALSAGGSLRPAPASEDAPPPLPEVTAEDRRELVPPPELKPDNVRRSFDLRARPRELIEKVAGAYGITPIFDYDFPASEPEQRFHLDGVPWFEAVYALQLVTNSFYAPINSRMALFAKDSAAKRGEVEPSVAVSIPFPETMSAQELQDVSNAVRSAFALTKVSIDSNGRAMVLRDRLSRVRPAMEVARQLLSGPAEVYVDVELYSVDNTSDLSRGLALQTSFPIIDYGQKAGLTLTAPTAPSGYNMVTFGGGKTFLGVGLSDASVLASLTSSMAHQITRASLRSVSGQQATLHIGDRYPIVQQSWGAGTTGTSTSSAYALTPSITFEDLGVVVKLTPRVHDASSLTLDFDAEYTVLSGSTSDSIPIISSRKFTVQVRMKFGESAVIAGLVQNNVSRTNTGLPLLSWVPLFNSHTESRDNERFLLVLRPTLLRLPPSEFPSYGVWSGTEVRGLPFDLRDRGSCPISVLARQTAARRLLGVNDPLDWATLSSV